MDAATIFGLIEKGVTLIPVLLQAGEDVATTVSNLQKLAAAGKAGTSISDEDLASIEAQFDQDLSDFNTPM